LPSLIVPALVLAVLADLEQRRRVAELHAVDRLEVGGTTWRTSGRNVCGCSSYAARSVLKATSARRFAKSEVVCMPPRVGEAQRAPASSFGDMSVTRMPRACR
jgi:hypothetical protein